MTFTELEFKQANAPQPKAPRAQEAHYDPAGDCVVIRLDSGVSLSFPPRLAQGLVDAKPAQLAQIDISPSGQGLHFPALDVDLHLPALIHGVLGSASWMAGQQAGRPAAQTSRSLNHSRAPQLVTRKGKQNIFCIPYPFHPPRMTAP